MVVNVVDRDNAVTNLGKYILINSKHFNSVFPFFSLFFFFCNRSLAILPRLALGLKRSLL
jgi:hypothetical protein